MFIRMLSHAINVKQNLHSKNAFSRYTLFLLIRNISSTIKHPFSIPDGAPGTTEAEKRQATVDKEPGPSDNDNDGDGFTVFEEYRGFMTTGTDPHTRPSPFVKNVFVACQGTTVSYGVGDANEMPDHTFTRVDLTYVNDPFSVISN